MFGSYPLRTIKTEETRFKFFVFCLTRFKNVYIFFKLWEFHGEKDIAHSSLFFVFVNFKKEGNSIKDQ
jgi:hypothetical protein